MLSTILGASIFLGAVAISAEVDAPSEERAELTANLEGDTQIELPSSALGFPPIKTKQQQLEEIKAEGERLQKEREEAERQRLAKIEAERKAKEEAERKAREEAERKRLAEIERQKAIEREKARQIRLAEQRKQEQARQAQQVKQQAQQKKQQTQTQPQGQGTAFNASYYTPYCNGCSGRTATGENVKDSIYVDGMRVIAVDPNVIPLYSIVQVTTPHESFKAIALDTGGAIKGHKVDILVADTKTAIKLGRHTVHIKVLSSGK